MIARADTLPRTARNGLEKLLVESLSETGGLVEVRRAELRQVERRQNSARRLMGELLAHDRVGDARDLAAVLGR